MSNFDNIKKSFDENDLNKTIKNNQANLIRKDIGKIKIDIDEAVRKWSNLNSDHSWGNDIPLYRTVKTLDGFDLELTIKMDFDLKKMEV